MLLNSIKKGFTILASKKEIIIISVFFIISNTALAQTEKAAYKLIANAFEKNYNSDNYQQIFSTFSSNFKKAVPLSKLNAFLTDLKSKAGKILQKEFINYKKESVAFYKTIFERALLTLNISLDTDSKINGFAITPFKKSNSPKLKRNRSKLILPFNETWNVLWGGDTKELNFHVINETQKNAFDMIIKNKKGKSYKTNGKRNEDYYAFGKKLIAPCAGEIVLVVDGVKDNIPGEMDDSFPSGNTVIMKTIHNEYLFFAHFKQHSIKVKQGEMVKQGDFLGRCGNSGYSTEPHLHFHIQNTEKSNVAIGVKSYFNSIVVNNKLKIDYAPIKGDIIRNK